MTEQDEPTRRRRGAASSRRWASAPPPRPPRRRSAQDPRAAAPRRDAVPARDARKESEAEKRKRPLPRDATTCRPSTAPTATSAEERAMLIKRSDGQAARQRLACAYQGSRRRRARTAAASCARPGWAAPGSPRCGTAAAPAQAQAQARRRRAGPRHADPAGQERLHPLLGRLHRHRRGAERRLGRAGAGLGIADQPRHALRQGRLGAGAGAWRPAAEIPDEAGGRAWQRLSWDQALDEIAAKLLEIRAALRRRRRCSGWAAPSSPTRRAYLFRKFGAFWGTNNVDHQARICHSTTVAGVANTWGYGAQTNSYNDIRNVQDHDHHGRQPGGGASDRHAARPGRAWKLNRANLFVIDPRFTRTAAHATDYVRIRPGTDIPVIWGMLWHIFQNGWEDKEFIRQRVYGMDEVRAEVAKWHPQEVERVTGVPEAQLKRMAQVFATQKPATLIWCMGATQKTVGTANVRAFSILLLATGNVGRPGTGANIFRGHTNVQGATDFGLDVATLPAYYGLDEAAWRHWCRVWECRLRVDARAASPRQKLMETPGIPSTRWFDAVTLPQDQVEQPRQLQGHVRHGPWRQHRHPHAGGGEGAGAARTAGGRRPAPDDLCAVLRAARRHLPAADLHAISRRVGSRTASNRSLQWGEQIVQPIFESRNDYDVMYDLAKRLGFADEMFKNIDIVERRRRRASRTSCARSTAAPGRSGYTGQSPERLRPHMANQEHFDLVTLRGQAGHAGRRATSTACPGPAGARRR